MIGVSCLRRCHIFQNHERTETCEKHNVAVSGRGSRDIAKRIDPFPRRKQPPSGGAAGANRLWQPRNPNLSCFFVRPPVPLLLRLFFSRAHNEGDSLPSQHDHGITRRLRSPLLSGGLPSRSDDRPGRQRQSALALSTPTARKQDGGKRSSRRPREEAEERASDGEGGGPSERRSRRCGSLR